MSVNKPKKPKLYIELITGRIVDNVSDLEKIQFASIGKNRADRIRIKPNEKGWEVYKNRQMITQISLTPYQLHLREKFFVEQLEKQENERTKEKGMV